MDPFEQSEEELFIEWLELPLDQRKEFLDTVCLNDQVKRSDVLELIKAFEESEGLFEVTPEEDFSEVAAEVQSIAPSDESAGDQIGRYKLVDKIGEGAWGSVWLANQTEDIDRLVALKILKLGLDTKEFLNRFEAERQMLAMMEHPSIATIHDAGSTDYGRPYLVMELVRGKPMLEYAEEKQMTLEERVELYIRICQALDHAHMKGVIHRDIKPSNILVAEQDDGPVPKVIDFGVAKTNQVRLGNRTLFTSFHTFTGTPLYSSPEQLEFSGETVDHRSDVYSLGVLLYEFLVGAPPFDHDELSKVGLDGMRKIVRENDPPVPSRRFVNLESEQKVAIAQVRNTESSKLESQLKGDLDWVVMKCLEKDRKRRYQSAHELADDLQAYLDMRPVSAAAPSIPYRVAKFVQRNRIGQMTWFAIPGIALCLVGLFLYLKSQKGTSVEFVSPFAMELNEGSRSVAVLPFKTLSSDDDNEFIAAGLHGELTTSLARIQDLKTIARESTLRYRDSSKTLGEIGRDLGVITVVTGDVQLMGENMRVNVQLIDVVDKRTIWGDSYTRAFNPDNFFDVQSEISAAIIDELGSLLSPEANRSAVPTQNMEALAAYFKGEEIQKFSDLTRYPEATALFEKAIELDPEFVEAYAGLAMTLFASGTHLLHPGAQGYRAMDISRTEALKKSKELRVRAFEVAAKGLELDASLLGLQVPFVFNSMHQIAGGGVELDDSLLDLPIPFVSDSTQAERKESTRAFLDRYIEERPNEAGGYLGMAYWHTNVDKKRFATELKTPDNPEWMAALESRYKMWEKAVELDPTNPWHRKELAATLKLMGRSDDYMEQLKLNVYHNPDVAVANEDIANELVSRSRFDEAMIFLRKAYALGTNNYAETIIRIFEHLGDNEDAMRWFERARVLYPRRAKMYEIEIMRLRGGEEEAVNLIKKFSSDKTIFSGTVPYKMAVRNFDLRSGLHQEGSARYFAFDPFFLDSNVVELVKAGEFKDGKKVPIDWWIIAMELAAFLLGDNESAKGNGLLDAVAVQMERSHSPFLFSRFGPVYGAPGDSPYLYYQAIYHTLRGDKKRALELLRQAVNVGFRNRYDLDDARFDPLREEPEFIELINIIETDLAQQLANIRRMEMNGEFAAIPTLPERK